MRGGKQMTQASDTWGSSARSPRTDRPRLARRWGTSSTGAAIVGRLVAGLLWAALVGLTLLIAP